MVCKRLWHVAAFSLFIAATGCGISTTPAGSTPQNQSVKGTVKGGQQPISGASVQLYAAGSGGDGSAATPLFATPVTTDANGGFNFAGLFACPGANAQVYLAATGGNPGLAAANPAIAEMAALGPCSQLSAATFININEVTTVAATSALAPFMSAVNAVGSSTSDVTSLQAAFTAASQFADVATGTSPGVNIPVDFAVPSSKIDTLADVVAACINSPGGTAGDGSPCGQLFTLTTLPGGAAPTTTATALLNLAASPAQNTAALYGLVSPSAPFQPQLPTAPADFAIRLVPLNNLASNLQITPATGLTFPATQLGSSAAVQQLTLTNTGSAALTVSTIAISGTNAADYAIFSNCVAALAGQTACTISITFSPSADGPSTAYLVVSSTAANSPSQVPLAGTGTGTAPVGGGGTGNPAATAAGAYVFTGSTWTPLTTTSIADVLPYVPPSLDLYCLNTALAQWVACPSVANSGSTTTIANVTTLLKGNGAGGAVGASAQDVAAAITSPALTSQYLTTTIPANPGNQNLIMGYNAGGNLFTGSGTDAGTGGQQNVILGYNAAANATTSRESVYIGANAGLNITGNGSGPDDMIEVLIGSLAGAHLTNLGGASVMIGQKAGLI